MFAKRINRKVPPKYPQPILLALNLDTVRHTLDNGILGAVL